VRTRLWAASAIASTGPPTDGVHPGRHARDAARAAYLPSFALVLVGMGLGVAALASPSVRSAAFGSVVPPAAALAVVGGAVSARTVRRRVVIPLRHLEEAASTLAATPVGWPGGIPDGGDLGALVQTIGALSVEIERSRAIEAVLERSADLTVEVDARGLIRRASSSAATMLGRPAAWTTGKHLAALVHPDDRTALEELLARPVGSTGRTYDEIRLSHLHGHWVTTEVTAMEGGGPGTPGRVLNVRDVSERKAHEEELLRRALYDPLTGLANRALFREHVDKALARLRRTPARPHAVLFVDLDDFKTINDSLGHAAGDQVLIEVGHRLLRWMRPGDTAARLGGDEFSVLLENTSQLDTALLAKRILSVLLAPIVVQGKEVVVTGSIGIALSEAGQDSDALLRNADAAMYTAKSAGKGQYRVFEPEMHHAAMRRLDLEADLRRAVTRDELFLAYQPIVDLATQRVTGTEVLVRWQHPDRGVIMPADFITVAEDSGFIREMGRHILDEACRQVATWHRRYPSADPVRLCVNTSVRQIEDEDFFGEVAAALAVSGLNGRYLTLEITENLFMHDFAATVAKLRRLKELGLTLAVDDFGTGYSSLSYLRSLPIDILKIDKSFVVGVTSGPEQSAVARAVVRLARTFNLQTVAEGIERREQAAELLAIGADMGQGYLFARPLAAQDMEAYLEASRIAVPVHGAGLRIR
jgi:diguanylate cyclase (GGDEF)-like protein/PAS domain S-box-containing protein